MDIPLDELYQEIILEHYRRPRNHCTTALPAGGTHVHADNPSCGDELDLRLELDPTGQLVTGIRWQGHGCSISQASASMMSQAVRGLTPSQSTALIDQVRAMMHGETPAEELEDVVAFEGVSQLPLRVKCVLLAWLALGDALAQATSAAAEVDADADANAGAGAGAGVAAGGVSQ